MLKIIHISLITSLLLSQAQNCLASKNTREYFNYDLKYHNTVVYRGQTNDLERRKNEHRRDGKKFTHMNKVGNAKTQTGARKAEKQSLEIYRKGHAGKNPKYNQTNHG